MAGPSESIEVARGGSDDFKHKIDERGSSCIVIIDSAIPEVPLEKVDRGLGVGHDFDWKVDERNSIGDGEHLGSVTGLCWTEDGSATHVMLEPSDA